MKRLKQITSWTLRVLLGLLLLLGLSFEALQTPFVKERLGHWLEALLSSRPDVRVRIGPLEGFLPFEVQVEELAVGDGDGEWLSAKDVRFSWLPLSAFQGRWRIQVLSAAKVELARIPKSSEAQKKSEADPGFRLPPLPVFILDRFAVEQFSLEEAVMGRPAEFSINGRVVAGEPSGTLEGALLVRRIKGPRSLADIKWSVGGKPEPRLALDASIQESTEGFLQAFAGIEGAGPSSFELHGEGPLGSWKGRLKVTADNLGTLESRVSLKMTGRPAIGGEGEIMVAPARLPEEVKPLLRDHKVQFALDVQYPEDEVWVIHEARFKTEGVEIGLGGSLDLEKKHLDGHFNLALEDLAPLSSLAGGEISGGLSAKGRFSGPLLRPGTDLAVTLQKPGWRSVKASGAAFELALEPLSPLWGTAGVAFSGLDLRGGGRVDTLIYGSEHGIPPQDLEWSLAATAAPGKPIEINELVLKNDAISTTSTGQIDPGNGFIKADTSIELSDLSRISSLFGMEIRGEARIEVSSEGRLEGGSLSARIRGQANRLGPLPPGLDPLMEKGLSFGMIVDLEGGRRVRVSDLRAAVPSVEFRGEGALDLLDRTSSGRGQVRFPSLAPFSRFLGYPLEGDFGFELEGKDFFKDPQFFVKGTGHHLLINQIPIQELSLSLSIQDLIAGPKGRIEMDLLEKGQRVRAGSEIALEGRRLLLTGLHLKSGDTAAAGDLRIELNDWIAEGALKGLSDDLRQWSPFLAEDLGGRLTFETQWVKGIEGQDLLFKVRGSKMRTPWGTAGELDCSGRLDNIFKGWKGKVTLGGKNLRRDDLALQSFDLRAEGGSERVGFSASGKGVFRDAIDFNTKGDFNTEGSISYTQDSGRLQVDRLEGRFGDTGVALGGPAVIRIAAGQVVLEESRFHLNQGTLRIDGRYGDDALSLNARMEGMSLAPLRLIGAPDLTGRADGDMHITGTPERPEGELRLQLADVRLRDEAFHKLPPAKVTTKASFRDGLLQMDLSIDGVTEKPAGARVRVPAVVSFNPFEFGPGPRGGITGDVLAEMRLERIPAFFPMEDHKMAGLLILEGEVGGSIASPEMKGSLRVQDGSYENARSGTVLTNIQVLAALKDDRLEITMGRAEDGSRGVVEIGGHMRFDPAEGFPFESKLKFDQCTLVRRDDLTALTDGILRFSGKKQAAHVSGTLTVGPAEIRIPERLPPEVAELEVQEINFPESRPGPKEKPEQEQGGALTLDLQIESPGRIFIRGRGLESEWRGSLKVSGRLGKPVIKGGLSVVRGRFNLFGKPFSLTKGTVNFSGATPPEPQFDVQAENSRSGLTTRIRFSGTPSSPDIALSSEPGYPKDEILSRLLFGKGVTGITPMEAFRLASALNTLSGGASVFDFMDRTRKLIGVDELDLKQSEGGGKSASVSVGKYLKDDVYLEVEKGVGSEGGKVSVEVDLTPNISVESETGLDTQSGVGINWKWDY